MPGLSPWKPMATMLASTALVTTIVKLRTLKRRRMTSRAKKTPAMGALKVAATPPAAPAATSSDIISGDWRVHWAKVEARAAPIEMIGPERPTEPPAPIVRADAAALTKGTRGRMRPPRASTAYMTSGTPWPRASLATRWTRKATGSAASTGTQRIIQLPPRSWSASPMRSKNRSWSSSIASVRMTALRPATMPTAAARMNGVAGAGTRCE